MTEVGLVGRAVLLRILFVFFLLSSRADCLAGDRISGSVGFFLFTDPGDDLWVSDRSYEASTEYQFINAGVCYITSQICMGASYLEAGVANKISYASSNDDWRNGEATTKYSGLGFKIGYSGDAGLVATYTHLITPKMEVTEERKFSTIITNYRVQVANMIDIGYGFKVADLHFGPLLSQVSFVMNKYTDSEGNDVEVSRTDTFRIPYLAIWLDF